MTFISQRRDPNANRSGVDYGVEQVPVLPRLPFRTASAPWPIVSQRRALGSWRPFQGFQPLPGQLLLHEQSQSLKPWAFSSDSRQGCDLRLTKGSVFSKGSPVDLERSLLMWGFHVYHLTNVNSVRTHLEEQIGTSTFMRNGFCGGCWKNTKPELVNQISRPSYEQSLDHQITKGPACHKCQPGTSESYSDAHNNHLPMSCSQPECLEQQNLTFISHPVEVF